MVYYKLINFKVSYVYDHHLHSTGYRVLSVVENASRVIAQLISDEYVSMRSVIELDIQLVGWLFPDPVH